MTKSIEINRHTGERETVDAELRLRHRLPDDMAYHASLSSLINNGWVDLHHWWYREPKVDERDYYVVDEWNVGGGCSNDTNSNIL